jgi:hypothetical protein
VPMHKSPDPSIRFNAHRQPQVCCGILAYDLSA